MSNVIGSAGNTAFYSARQGLNSASEGISQAAENIARTNKLTRQGEQQAASMQQPVNATSVPGPVTQDLISLTINSTQAQASAKALGVANDTVGFLIDTLA